MQRATIDVEDLRETNPGQDLPPEELIFGHTRSLEEVRRKVLNVAGANVPVLIRGENGTGKEVVGKLIHAISPWSQGSFVKVHCPAIPGTLLESELFGFEEGAFTGAVRTKPGRVEAAHGGTLFLDEIGEMEPSLQTKLLQFLQDGLTCRVGGEEERKLDIRLICATNRILEQEIENGRFRQDLFYRINVVSLWMPPLRERKEDIPDLVDYFIKFYGARYNRQPKPPSATFLALLHGHSWPGNLRELENLINRYVILSSEEIVTREIESRIPGSSGEDKPWSGFIPLRKIAKQAAREAERRTILQVLQANQGSRKGTAKALNISYRALLYKIKNTGIPPKRALWSRPEGKEKESG